MNSLKNSLRNLFYYPSAVLGTLVVFLLVFLAIYAMVKIPYNEAIRLWRGGEEVWYQNPKFAPPSWINLFSSKKYAESFSARTTDGSMVKEVTPGDEGVSQWKRLTRLTSPQITTLKRSFCISLPNIRKNSRSSPPNG